MAEESSKALVVTIDGPSGAGKTSVSKLLAQKLGYRYIDTGALYRAIALAARQQGVSADDESGLAELCRRLTIDLRSSDSGLRVILDRTDVTDAIRDPHISMLASAVSAQPVVRSYLLTLQRALASSKSVVAEGRDMGTVVLPWADAKFFLDADPRIRAQRRFEELSGQNDAPDLESVEKDMILRDKNDSTRAVAPLEPASDAIRIDSTRLSLKQVVDCMLDHIRRIP
jgi:cytidylate kinase